MIVRDDVMNLPVTTMEQWTIKYNHYNDIFKDITEKIFDITERSAHTQPDLCRS